MRICGPLPLPPRSAAPSRWPSVCGLRAKEVHWEAAHESGAFCHTLMATPLRNRWCAGSCCFGCCCWWSCCCGRCACGMLGGEEALVASSGSWGDTAAIVDGVAERGEKGAAEAVPVGSSRAGQGGKGPGLVV